MTKAAETMEYRWHQRERLCSVVFVLDHFPSHDPLSPDKCSLPRWLLFFCSSLAYGNHSFPSSFSGLQSLGARVSFHPPHTWASTGLFPCGLIFCQEAGDFIDLGCKAGSLCNLRGPFLETEYKIRYKGKHLFKMSKSLTNFKI